jgi:uncharacterized protein (TIGR02145 family)
MKRYFEFLLLVGIIASSVIVISCSKDENPIGSVGEITGTFTDGRDNRIYKWVTIGTQTWMAENLVFIPSNGNYITLNNNESNVAVYGYFYDWETAQNVAPEGWHLPSEAEWLELVNFLGGEDVAGGKMKEIGTIHWNNPNTGATNSSGFSALGPGYYDPVYDLFQATGNSAGWWSSTDEYGDNNDAAFYLWLSTNGNFASRGAHSKIIYYSVRCLKD